MIKVLHVIPSLRKGGAERLAVDICNEINSRKDAQAKLVLLRDDDQYQELTGNTPVEICNSYVRLSVLKHSHIELSDFEKITGEFKPDVIHSHLFEAEIVTREKLFNRMKYFTHCHDNMPQLRNFTASTLFNKSRLTDFYEKKHLVARYLKCNNHFIAISEDTKTYFSKVLPVGAAKNITLLHNAINFKLFNSVNRKRKLDKIRIINAGSFVRKKNQQLLVDIAEQLKNRGLAAEIKMLGEGDLRGEIYNDIKSKGMEDMFSLPGNVQQIENYYAEANIYVHTASYEPFGLVLLEAMASGLPVVALDGVGNRGLVKEGINGYFITEARAAAFVEAIMKVRDTEQKFEEMSRNAVDFARTFDITGYVDRLIKLYLSV